jgi:hypothetical protein
MGDDFEVFEGKTLNSIFRDIYNNQTHKKHKIETLLDSFKEHIKNVRDLSEVGSVITSLVDTSIRNDEQLIKMATIAQRIMVANIKTSGADSSILTDEEKEQLLQNVREVEDSLNSIQDKI